MKETRKQISVIQTQSNKLASVMHKGVIRQRHAGVVDLGYTLGAYRHEHWRLSGKVGKLHQSCPSSALLSKHLHVIVIRSERQLPCTNNFGAILLKSSFGAEEVSQ